MATPSVMVIEMGAALLKSIPDDVALAQRKALDSFGDYRARAIGATGLSEDFKKGYELGLATARTMIAMGTKNI